nr:dynein heavy chain 2, axonemal-like [Aedes albopictus]
MSALLSDKRSVLLLSDSTVGKSALIRNILTGSKEDNSNICISNLTSKTTVTSLRRILTHHSMKVSQEIIYPKQRKNLTWFIDDMHNVATNQLYVLEFLRNFLEHHCWHDSNHLQRLKQTNVVAAMRNPIILGKHEATFRRLINKFHIIFHSKSDDESIICIFKRRIDSLMADEITHNLPTAIPSATVDLIRHLSASFFPTPVKPRYDYSLKTISRIIDMFCILNQTPLLNGSNHLRLWIHECYREIHDILDRTDYAKFYDIFNNTMLRYFDVSLHGICPGNQSPVFSDVLCQNSTYQDITEVESLR